MGAITAIYTIQGSGATSPYANQTVPTQGVVTRVTNNGFYMQDPQGDFASDAQTSAAGPDVPGARGSAIHAGRQSPEVQDLHLQSCFNTTRVLQARQTRTFVASLSSGKPLAALLVGAFNAYAQEIRLSG